VALIALARPLTNRHNQQAQSWVSGHLLSLALVDLSAGLFSAVVRLPREFCVWESHPADSERSRELWAARTPRSGVASSRPAGGRQRASCGVGPELVAEVEYRGWTSDDQLRHASFKGLREDKDPYTVSRED
jgi:hypothetical protein